MSTAPVPESGFADLGLPAFVLDTLNRVGYEKPTPIQQATIPPLLEGRDIIGMAQTGTGKTAAFALPILSHIDVADRTTQALVLCPTRELAIQVAEAFQTYARDMRGFQVLPVYGGQDMGRQLQALRRGVHVIVATPGRLLDHIRRRSLDLGRIKTLVLDEADEMLRMGFIDDVDAILESTPPKRQVALFSATMPRAIRNVAEKHLREPQEVRIKTATSTNEDIRQFYWLVQGTNKLDALTRMLEVEEFDGMIVFVRTRNATVELADKLSARGFSAAPINGDMNQSLRQRTVQQLKSGALDILVATDVAARGLDVERISHVMNYDIPNDNEAYVHRIGRTGRAGRSGKAILFVAPRERRMLQSIEKTTRKKIERMELPSRDELIGRRSAAFRQRVAEAVEQGELDFFHNLVDELCREQECSIEDAAAAMARLLQQDKPLQPATEKTGRAAAAPDTKPDRPAKRRNPADAAPPARKPRREPAEDEGRARPLAEFPDLPMQRFRVQPGHDDGVTPSQIMGAIANEAGLDGRYIGHIRIQQDHSTVDLPEGMPEETFRTLRKAFVCNKPLALEPVRPGGKAGAGTEAPARDERSRKPGPAGKSRPGARAGDQPPPKRKKKSRAVASGFGPPKKKKEKPPKDRARYKEANKDKGKRRTPKNAR